MIDILTSPVAKHMPPMASPGTISAIATSFAAMVALFATIFGEPIRRRWQGHPDLVVTGTDQSGNEVRLRIKNNGKRQAEDVEVLLTAVSRRIDGADVPIPKFSTMNLRWAFLSPTNHSGATFLEIFITISPEITRYLFLGAMKLDARGNVKFELWTQYKPPQWSNELSPGQYKIELQLGMADYKAKAKHVLLTVPDTQDASVQVELL